MKAETLIVKLCGIMMVTYFAFDGYRKYSFAEDTEGERVKIKFNQFEEWLATYGLQL